MVKLRGRLQVALHAQRQRLGSLQEEPRIVRSNRRPQVSERNNAHPQDAANCVQIAKVVRKPYSVLAWFRLVHRPKRPRGPVKLPGIHNDTANAGAVPANLLGERVADDVRTVLDGSQQVRSRECRVHDERGMTLVRDLRGATFERGDPLLERILLGVHDPGIDVAQIRECEEVRGVVAVPRLYAVVR